MLSPGIVATVAPLIFVAELPDKTAIASLVLGSKFPGRWVFAGVASAFAVHVIIATAAGSLIALLPHRPLEIVVAVLFLVGALLIWCSGNEEAEEEEREVAEVPPSASFGRVYALGFGVIFVAEWGDLTQILCANLAAKYHDPLGVGVGAALGLWAVGGLAIVGGKSLLRVLPIRLIVRVAAVVMVGLAAYSLSQAVG